MKLEEFDEIKIRKFLDNKGGVKSLTFIHPLGESENKDPECRAYLSVLANAPDIIKIGSSQYHRSKEEGHVGFEGLNQRYVASIDVTYVRKK